MDNYTIPNDKTFNNSIGAIKSCGYKPEPTKLLIFKSTLLHMVEKNLSNENRIRFVFKQERNNYIKNDYLNHLFILSDL